MTEQKLIAFGEAWNAQDADLVMSFMTEDCTFHASIGPELLGKTYIGADEVRAGVQAFFDRFPGGRFEDSSVFVGEGRGASEWTFTWTDGADEPHSVRGCDLFEFDGGLIRVKNAFRKQTG